MAGRRQQSAAAHLHAEDVGERYVPPPNAYPERTRRVARTEQIATQPAATQVAAPVSEATDETPTLAGVIAQKLIGGLWAITGGAAVSLLAYSVRRAQERAEKVQAEPQAHPQPAASSPPKLIVNTVGMSWWKQMYVYTGLLLMGYGIWLLDGAFTVAGAVTTILPLTLISVGVAVAGHFFLSWGQHSLIFNPRLLIKTIGLSLLALNAISNVYGFNAAARVLRPELLGSLPTDPKDWVIGLAEWIQAILNKLIDTQAQTPQPPSWRYAALIVLVLALALAWYAEKIRDYFHSQWKIVKDQRPT